MASQIWARDTIRGSVSMDSMVLIDTTFAAAWVSWPYIVASIVVAAAEGTAAETTQLISIVRSNPVNFSISVSGVDQLKFTWSGGPPTWDQEIGLGNAFLFK